MRKTSAAWACVNESAAQNSADNIADIFMTASKVIVVVNIETQLTLSAASLPADGPRRFQTMRKSGASDDVAPHLFSLSENFYGVRPIRELAVAVDDLAIDQHHLCIGPLTCSDERR